MSSTYNSITFYPGVGDGGLPEWEQEPNVSFRVIPGANKDDLHCAGRGNWRLSFRARFSSLANLQTMQGSVGATARTLTLEGTAYTSTRLAGVRSAHREGRSSTYTAELNFERDGT